MASTFETLVAYLQYPFVVYAVIVGTLIALCAALLGVTLVLKRLSYIGDGLSHVAFGAMAIASVMKFTDDMPFILFITAICAILLLYTGKNRKIKGDAALAMLSVGALAIGYLLMNVFGTSTNLAGDVCTTLFGSTSILTLSQSDVVLCTALSLAVIILFVVFYQRFFAVTFDESFATAVGTKSGTYNLLLAVMIAVIIVLSMNLVGSLLITALVIFPALSAMKLFRSFKSVTIFAAALSVVCALVGRAASILYGTPVGSTIVVADMVAFGLSYGISAIWNGAKV
ncbi:MAG: metal ABC transporter permease [Eubacteriales bacterium]